MCERGAPRRVAQFGVTVTVTMSRKAAAEHQCTESFFATSKAELVHDHTGKRRIELRATVFDYIKVTYNCRRLLSSPSDRRPAQTEFSTDSLALHAQVSMNRRIHTAAMSWCTMSDTGPAMTRDISCPSHDKSSKGSLAATSSAHLVSGGARSN